MGICPSTRYSKRLKICSAFSLAGSKTAPSDIIFDLILLFFIYSVFLFQLVDIQQSKLQIDIDMQETWEESCESEERKSWELSKVPSDLDLWPWSLSDLGGCPHMHRQWKQVTATRVLLRTTRNMQIRRDKKEVSLLYRLIPYMLFIFTTRKYLENGVSWRKIFLCCELTCLLGGAKKLPDVTPCGFNLWGSSKIRFMSQIAHYYSRSFKALFSYALENTIFSLPQSALKPPRVRLLHSTHEHELQWRPCGQVSSHTRPTTCTHDFVTRHCFLSLCLYFLAPLQSISNKTKHACMLQHY